MVEEDTESISKIWDDGKSESVFICLYGPLVGAALGPKSCPLCGPKFGPLPNRPYLATGLLVAVHTNPAGNLPTYVS